MRGPLLTVFLLTEAWGPVTAQGLPALPVVSPQVKVAPQIQSRPVVPKPSDIARLRSLVELAEKALAAEDEESGLDRVDEAEAYIADWSQDSLRMNEVIGLLERLTTVSKQLEEDTSAEEASPEAPSGIKIDEEVVGLTGEDLRAELARVRAAEQGVQYDFPIDLNDQVVTWVNIFSGRIKTKIETSLSRGSRYLPMIRQVFQEEGVPLDLAYLPLIESGYINGAKSYASAVGMWQFMRSTGRIFGLNGNAWVEERKDPVKSTRAAAKYLKQLYKISGDWYLALIGYNAGPLTTERAVTAMGTKNFWDLYRSRYLRTQTKNYVPEMCAAVLVGRHPERYGLNVQQQAPYAFETVEVDRMTSLTVMARYAGTDVDGIKDLNPELLRGSTPPGRYTLRVPPGTSGAVNRAFAKIPAGQRLDFQAYRIKKGDTLAKVAARFKVSPEDLLSSNDMKRGAFKVGRRIQVPPPSSVPIDGRDLLSKEERRHILGDQPLDSIPALPAEGSTITSIPPTPGAPGLPGSSPKVREEVLPPQPMATDPAGKPSPAKVVAAQPSPKTVFHAVKKGETLFSISKRYGVSLEDLKRWNRMKRVTILKGQKLRVSAP